MTKYTTIQGDTWDMIAYKVFGDETLMIQIMNLNLDYIDVSVFLPGQFCNCRTFLWLKKPPLTCLRGRCEHGRYH